jgi:hypothetical protein
VNDHGLASCPIRSGPERELKMARDRLHHVAISHQVLVSR